MKRAVLALLAAALAVIVAMRAERTGSGAAVAAMAPAVWDDVQYNVMAGVPVAGDQTAGSGVLAEMDRYFLGRAPTAKNDCTGLLAGKDLILILAEDWRLPAQIGPDMPALYRLWSEGVQFTQVYAPDWYQGREGREFALLTGLAPTTVGEETALAWTGERGISLPFALPRRLAAEGYACYAFPDGEDSNAAYEALGFGHIQPGQSPAGFLEALAAEGRPYFAYWVLPGGGGESALEALMGALDGLGQAERTAVCLVTGHDEPMRGRLFLWGAGLAGRRVDGPCSELDAAPTLLNLLGAEMDSRFTCGRDLFAPAGEDEIGPLVSLYGSAFSDWVTGAGYYEAGRGVFTPADGEAAGQGETERYTARVRAEVYGRYVMARRIMETDYFRAAGW